jgi:N-acetylglucosaminyl-diphospho-decaprenol L-rhamnosyltransferase
MISVIVANHNGEEHLARCLGGLGGSRHVTEVLLVDNGSRDGSLDIVKNQFPSVTILDQETNLGFGAANNLAAERARGEALLLLNVDAWFAPQTLDILSARFEADPGLGLVAPRLRYPDGGRQFSWSPARGILGEVLQKLRNPFEASSWAHGRLARACARLAGRTFYTAACVLVRTAAFRAVGGFDTDFFMYFEDVDLCTRLEAAGWRLATEPRAIATHVGGFRRNTGIDSVYRPSQLRFYRTRRPAWEAWYMERRLRRRYGDAEVDGWLGAEKTE